MPYQAPSHITSEQFLQWRSPRRGATNPEILTNDLWTWAVKTHNDDGDTINAYWVNETFGGPSSVKAGPCWCFQRFGQTKTELPDGRTLYVAGEHEDFYDPDFFIYNDVTVVDAAGNIAFFGYPEDIFPPTDFHSATLADDALILIGNLSYPQNRKPGFTQVLRLELDTWCVVTLETTGTPPGWIHGHQARLAADGNVIQITGGEMDRHDSGVFVDNIDDWCLDLERLCWSRLTQRKWPRFQFMRKDLKENHLFDLEQVRWHQKLGWEDRFGTERKLKKELGKLPDLSVLDTLYAPPVPFETVEKNEDDDTYNIHDIRVDGVPVRYVQEGDMVKMTIQGELPEPVIEILKADMLEKLSALERTQIICGAIFD